MAKKIKLEHVLLTLYMVVVSLALYVWSTALHNSGSGLNAFNVFPLFGLLAFSLMWVHYVSGVIRDYFFPGESTHKTFIITSYVVLLLILLHPTILLFKLWSLGQGLPPGSYKAYGASNVIYLELGTVAFICFLLFEGKRWFGKRKWWPVIDTINDIAIILIMIHSLHLGQHLQTDWFRYVWYFYIVTLLLCLARKYYRKFVNSDRKK